MSDQPQRPTRVRYLIVLLATVMSFLLYLDRFCVSFAADYIKQDLGLTQSQMSLFLSAFFWSYALAQVPSGWLSDRYGARIMLAIYIFTWSVFTVLIGAASGFLMLTAARLFCGLGQAGAYPTSAGVVKRWMPLEARATASAWIGSGGRVGGALAPVLTAYLMIWFVPMGTPLDFDNDAILEPDSAVSAVGDDSGSAKSLKAFTSAAERAQFDRFAREAKSKAEASENKTDEIPLPLSAAEHEARRALIVPLLNRLLDEPRLYDEASMKNIKLPKEALDLLEEQTERKTLPSEKLRRMNRFILEGVLPSQIKKLYARGWRPILYLYGFAGVPVAALFWLLFREQPDQSRGVNDAELRLIRGDGYSPVPSGQQLGAIPLSQIVLSANMWHNSIMQFGTNIGWLFIVTWLPRYLLEVHNVPLLQRSFMTMLPTLIGMVGGMLGGWLSDVLARRYGKKWGRRLPILISRLTGILAYVLAIGITLLPSDHALNNPWVFVGLFTLVALSTDAGAPATWAFCQDVGGRHVGSVLGWGNMWGNLGAAVAPLLYNAALGEKPTLNNWMLMFGVAGGAFLVSTGSAIFIDATKTLIHDEESQP